MALRARSMIAASVALALLGVAVIAYVLFAPRGTGPLGLGRGAELRDYLGRQITGIINGYLVPTLSFQTVDYRYPGTVTLSNVRLTSPDSIDVFEVDSLVITLAEVPSVGKPIRIAEVEVKGGAVRLMRDSESGGFKGLSPLVRPAAGDGARQVEPSQQLSEVLVLEMIRLSGITLIYDDGSGSPMRIEGFEADLDITPAREQPGWYTLALNVGRLPGLELELNGAFNINDYVVELQSSTGQIQLDAQTAKSLPPQIQSVITQFDATGRVDISTQGSIPLLDPLNAQLDGTLNLRDFNVASGDYRLPIDSFTSSFNMQSGRLNLPDGVMTLLRGSGQIRLDTVLVGEPRTAHMTWSLTDLQLQEALRIATPSGEPPKLAGLLHGSGVVRTAIDDPLASLAGEGSVHVRDGRLLVLPGLLQLISQIGNLKLSDDQKLTHRADAEFTLRPEGINITQSEVITELIAARAQGLIAFDGSLDMTVNAGPLARLQSALGRVGNIFGQITDRLLTYRLRGTVDAPTVSVAPLGIGG